MQRTHQEYRQALIDGAMATVARNGIENVTTRSVCKEAGLSEVYIYRYFLDKEDLLAKAFIYDDRSLAVKVEKEFNTTSLSGLSYEERIRSLLEIIWKNFIEYKEMALYYYHYYYSFMMTGTFDAHYEIWGSFLDSVSVLFRNSKNIHRLTDTVLETVMNAAIKVHLGLEKDEEELKKSIFGICIPLVIRILSQEPNGQNIL